MQCFIALGANLGDPARTFEAAIAQMTCRIGELLARSKWMQSEPLVHPDYPSPRQPAYLNGVVALRTELDPPSVLQQLLLIERLLGRDRATEKQPWGPRVLDLDLIDAGGLVYSRKNLVLPHPEMHKRPFVLQPLAEIAPNWRHPTLNAGVFELLEGLAVRDEVEEEAGR
ncbi:MAG: 2-amino-4-hydroxy-6-hydroxymethyldihydropteridine diphosphokinase [Bdellovibrionales bacterium]|nr:2-amino-4-hydroxy-6-hydroxymethyldihydropteridine diphosphokinase [Bdellovibrionales bacterium]